MLSGKYARGLPSGSRLALPGYEWLKDAVYRPETIAAVALLGPIAVEIGATVPQLGIAWCARNPRVSTVITGASRPEQVAENLKALDFVPKLSPEILSRIDEALKPAMGKVAG